MKKIIFLLTLSTVFFGACKDEKKQGEETKKEGFVIEGKIENGRGSLIKLGQVTANGTMIVSTDTADLNGNFRLEGYVREKFVAIFNFDMEKRIFLVVDTNSKITLSIPENYDNYTVSGSDESQEFVRVRDIEVRSGKELALIRKEAEAIDQDDEAKMNKLRDRFTEISKKYNQEFIDSFRTSSSVLVPLFFYYELQLPFDEPMKKIIYERAQASGLQNDIVAGYMRQYTAEMSTAVGNEAPSISLTDTAGNVISLSDLRGKVVLLDFWASWCGPCRMENPNVVRVYQQYKDKGFEILGVSLDNERFKWIEAIHQDNIYWKHVSDLKGWQSSAARLYAVTSIPATFLIDREGKIIAKNLRGEALQKKIAEVLK